MTKQARSVRLPDRHHRFIEQSAFDFANEVRTWLDSRSVSYAAGVCAICGEIVFLGGHGTVTGSTPAGEALGLDSSHEIDICDSCWDDVSNAMMNAEMPEVELEYLNSCSNYLLYRAERDAIIDAQPSSEWSLLITNRELLTNNERIGCLHTWVCKRDLAEMYPSGGSIDPQEVYDRVLQEQKRVSPVEEGGESDE